MFVYKKAGQNNSVNALQGLQRRRDFIVIYFVFLFYFLALLLLYICDLVHDVDTVHVLC